MKLILAIESDDEIACLRAATDLMTTATLSHDQVTVRLEGLVASPAVVGVLDAPIEELKLPLKAYNSLKREGIHTVGRLTELTREDLLDIRNFGSRSVDAVVQKLWQLGLRLRPTDEAVSGSSELDTELQEGLEKPLSEIGLSDRAYNCLTNYGCQFVGNVATLTYEKLIAIPRMSQETAEEIILKLDELGIKLRNQP